MEKWIAGSERIRLLQSTDFPFFGRLILPVAGRLLRLLPRRSDVVAMLAGQYGSMLMQPADRQVVRIDRASSQAWIAPLWPIGRHLIEAIPPESRPQTLFTVDAVLDSDEQLWMLEMNSNPTVHPLAYPAIVAGAMQSQQGHR